MTPWVVANIAFMALEAVCCMYSNILRDHINKVGIMRGIGKKRREE